MNMDILKGATNGRAVLVLPGYDHSKYTVLEYEEELEKLRHPYRELVKHGYLSFESRHGHKETYHLTARGAEAAKYST